MFAARVQTLQSLLCEGINPITARAFDSCAFGVSNCVPVYKTQITELLKTFYSFLEESGKEVGDETTADIQNILHQALQPQPLPDKKKRVVIKQKSDVKCPLCKSKFGFGVFNCDKTTRGDEMAKTRYKCLDKACNHEWYVG